jgi:hypothetical protein
MLGEALRWARQLHGDQVREVDRAAFILHPLEVASLLSGRGYDDEVVAAALLHDAVEDTRVQVAEIRRRLGGRIARIVDTLTEDPRLPGYAARKAALRTAVAEGDADAHAVYAADKVVKVRELRATAVLGNSLFDDPDLRGRLYHYETSLLMLQSVAPRMPLVQQLAFELWALRALPPRPRVRRPRREPVSR